MTTLTLYRYPTRHLLWALAQMKLAHKPLDQAPGLIFHKLMGSGGNGGFGIWPNWHVYALLAQWESEESWHQFNAANTFARSTQRRCSEQMTVCMQPIRTHGKWDGMNPFEPLQTQATSPDAPVAVLTRARIRVSKLPSFLRQTKHAKNALKDQEGLLLSIGVGETPLLYQATFSIWQNAEAIQQYAYRTPAHAKVVRQTQEKQWYLEEMFTRFHILGCTGTWQGLSSSADLAAFDSNKSKIQ
jgi:heme-degrading monooxygenase HmoA